MTQPLLQVTGLERSAGDVRLPALVHGWPVLCSLSHGEVLAIELADVQRNKGVLAILTADSPLVGEASRFSPLLRTLLTPRVTRAGQVVALVLAETRQLAQATAANISLRVRAQPAVLTVSAALSTGQTEPPVRQSSGQAAELLLGARTFLKQTYRTAARLSGSPASGVATAVWRGDALTVYAVGRADQELASLLHLSQDKLLMVMSAVGADAGDGQLSSLLASIAAAHLDRPVRVELPAVSLRKMVAETVQTLQLGLGSGDRPLAMLLHGAVGCPIEDRAAVQTVMDLATIYGFAHNEVSLVPLRLHLPSETRRGGPSGWHELSFSCEVAIDELAAQLGIDPLLLRQRWIGEGATGEGATLLACLKHINQVGGRGQAGESPPATSRDTSIRIGRGFASAVHRTESGIRLFGAHSVEVAVVDGRIELSRHFCALGVRPSLASPESMSVVLRALEQARRLALRSELAMMTRTGWTARTDDSAGRSASVPQCEVTFVSLPADALPVVGSDELARLAVSGVAASVVNALSAALGTRLRSLPPGIRVSPSGVK